MIDVHRYRLNRKEQLWQHMADCTRSMGQKLLTQNVTWILCNGSRSSYVDMSTVVTTKARKGERD